LQPSINSVTMAKEKQRKTAYILFVEQGQNRKEIAQLTGVSELTIGKWVKKYGWLKERAARNASPVKRSENMKSIITTLSEERLELARQTKEAELNGDLETIKNLRIQISKIDDAVAKWNKALITVDNESKITLSVYLHVMEQIFESLRIFDRNLYMQTINFQEHHLHDKTMELG